MLQLQAGVGCKRHHLYLNIEQTKADSHLYFTAHPYLPLV